MKGEFTVILHCKPTKNKIENAGALMDIQKEEKWLELELFTLVCESIAGPWIDFRGSLKTLKL